MTDLLQAPDLSGYFTPCMPQLGNIQEQTLFFHYFIPPVLTKAYHQLVINEIREAGEELPSKVGEHNELLNDRIKKNITERIKQFNKNQGFLSNPKYPQGYRKTTLTPGNVTREILDMDQVFLLMTNWMNVYGQKITIEQMKAVYSSAFDVFFYIYDLSDSDTFYDWVQELLPEDVSSISKNILSELSLKWNKWWKQQLGRGLLQQFRKKKSRQQTQSVSTQEETQIISGTQFAEFLGEDVEQQTLQDPTEPTQVDSDSEMVESEKREVEPRTEPTTQTLRMSPEELRGFAQREGGTQPTNIDVGSQVVPSEQHTFNPITEPPTQTFPTQVDFGSQVVPSEEHTLNPRTEPLTQTLLMTPEELRGFAQSEQEAMEDVQATVELPPTQATEFVLETPNVLEEMKAEINNRLNEAVQTARASFMEGLKTVQETIKQTLSNVPPPSTPGAPGLSPTDKGELTRALEILVTAERIARNKDIANVWSQGITPLKNIVTSQGQDIVTLKSLIDTVESNRIAMGQQLANAIDNAKSMKASISLLETLMKQGVSKNDLAIQMKLIQEQFKGFDKELQVIMDDKIKQSAELLSNTLRFEMFQVEEQILLLDETLRREFTNADKEISEHAKKRQAELDVVIKKFQTQIDLNSATIKAVDENTGVLATAIQQHKAAIEKMLREPRKVVVLKRHRRRPHRFMVDRRGRVIGRRKIRRPPTEPPLMTLPTAEIDMDDVFGEPPESPPPIVPPPVTIAIPSPPSPEPEPIVETVPIPSAPPPAPEPVTIAIPSPPAPEPVVEAVPIPSAPPAAPVSIPVAPTPQPPAAQPPPIVPQAPTKSRKVPAGRRKRRTKEQIEKDKAKECEQFLKERKQKEKVMKKVKSLATPGAKRLNKVQMALLREAGLAKPLKKKKT